MRVACAWSASVHDSAGIGHANAQGCHRLRVAGGKPRGLAGSLPQLDCECGELQLLSEPLGTVKSRMFRGLACLRERLAEFEPA